MPSSYTTNLRLTLPVQGELAGTWGNTVNTGITSLTDTAVAGYTAVSVTTAAQALTIVNGAVDEARSAILALSTTTTAPFAVYAPPVSKIYTLLNTSAYSATIYNSTVAGNTTAAGTGITVPAGSSAIVFTDGTNFRQASTTGGSGGGATGGGTDAAFYENDVIAESDYTIGQAAYQSGVAITIASPAVFTLANHGFVSEQIVHLSTTGALPTGLAVDTPYYVIAAGLTSSTFRLSVTSGGAAINTTGTQSGIHSVGKIKNAITGGPFAIASGKTITVPSGSVWSVI